MYQPDKYRFLLGKLNRGNQVAVSGDQNNHPHDTSRNHRRDVQTKLEINLLLLVDRVTLVINTSIRESTLSNREPIQPLESSEKSLCS